MAADDPTAARRLLRAQVADLATGVGLAVRTATGLNLPWSPASARAAKRSCAGCICSRT
jgi:hypothetical protein